MTVLFYFLSFVHSGGPLLFFHSIETLISPEVFAEVLCDDLDLPAAAFVPAVVQAIRQQIKQFDSDSEISLDKQTDQRVIIKVGCLEVLDNSLLLKLIAFDVRRTLRNLWGSCGRWDTCACQA